MRDDLDLQAKLITMYSTGGRHYRTWEHIQHCFRELDLLQKSDTEEKKLLQNYEWMAIEFAIMFHDVIYDPKDVTGNNEYTSANMAARFLYGMNAGDVRESWTKMADLTVKMIEATRNHKSHQNDTLAIKVFLDIDLAILGQPFEVYHEYTKNIMKEYAWVPRTHFLKAREQILRGWLESDRIYYTEYFRGLYETQARANIQSELDHLYSIR